MEDLFPRGNHPPWLPRMQLAIHRAYSPVLSSAMRSLFYGGYLFYAPMETLPVQLMWTKFAYAQDRRSGDLGKAYKESISGGTGQDEVLPVYDVICKEHAQALGFARSTH